MRCYLRGLSIFWFSCSLILIFSISKPSSCNSTIISLESGNHLKEWLKTLVQLTIPVPTCTPKSNPFKILAFVGILTNTITEAQTSIHLLEIERKNISILEWTMLRKVAYYWHRTLLFHSFSYKLWIQGICQLFVPKNQGL